MRDIRGQRFYRLLVIEPTPERRFARVVWLCVCDCGTRCTATSAMLVSGGKKSCGCLRAEANKANGARNRTHGLSDSPTRSAYQAMIGRCYRPKTNGYERYGGAGVTVCERWHTFANFVADMGVRPDGTTIDRIDNAKGYEPGNCRWATVKDQCRNKRVHRLLTVNGETKCLAAWAEQYDISRVAITRRISSGWSVNAAVTTPVRPNAGRSTYTAEEKGFPYNPEAAARIAVDADGEPVQENV